MTRSMLSEAEISTTLSWPSWYYKSAEEIFVIYSWALKSNLFFFLFCLFVCLFVPSSEDSIPRQRE